MTSSRCSDDGPNEKTTSAAATHQLTVKLNWCDCCCCCCSLGVCGQRIESLADWDHAAVPRSVFTSPRSSHVSDQLCAQINSASKPWRDWLRDDISAICSEGRDVNETKHHETEAEAKTKGFETKADTETLPPRPSPRPYLRGLGRRRKVYGLQCHSRC